MDKYQDTATGLEWHFEPGTDTAALSNVPQTLTAQIVPQPSVHHDWSGAGWTLNAAKQQAANNADLIAQIAATEAQQVRPVRELIVNPANAFAAKKLAALDAQIAALRAQLLP
ncbi:MAG: hypothetical protein Q7U78_05905 [Gallionella sp.]|nr:hypothetical protein [Gallionella sp.]